MRVLLLIVRMLLLIVSLRDSLLLKLVKRGVFHGLLLGVVLLRLCNRDRGRFMLLVLERRVKGMLHGLLLLLGRR
ncbi:hypothetical protein BC940DRAFT_302118 [Gongronella butleri]|nr:hypothetical protein BC940DRAFT_302118 [Gongronella butleri]